MEPSDPILKSFDFAAEGVKQLITLSTGIIAVMITFSKDLVGVVTPRGIRLLRASWTLYLVSMVAGVLALGAMTGALATDPKPSVYQSSIVLLSSVQWSAFLGGTGVLLVYGTHLLQQRSSTETAATDAQTKPAKKR